MAEANGLPANLSELVKAPMGHPEVVRVIEEALRDAQAGKLAAVGLVLVRGPGAIQAVHAGGFPMEVNAGCDLMKRAVLDAMTRRPSGLLRPVG